MEEAKRRITRRDMLQLAAGGVLGVLGTMVFSEEASGRSGGKYQPMEICQWIRVGGPACTRAGELVEYWAYRCCYGQRCDYFGISERIVGSC